VGKFLEGLQQARAAADVVAAEKARLNEIAAAAIANLTRLLKEDSDELALHQISLHLEHGALVVKKKLAPVAGISYDPSTALFKISEYAASKGGVEIAAQDAEDCAAKLGAYIFSLGS
jgi:hypothetical protein